MPMPEGSKGSKKVKEIEGSGEYEFGIISFEYPGTYTYKITEENTGTVGYKYDNSTYTVTYIVEEDGVLDEGGRKLTCERTITKDGASTNDVVFTNEYTKPNQSVPGEAPNLGGGQAVVAQAGFVYTGDNTALVIVILSLAIFSFALTFKIEAVKKETKKIYK